MAHRSVRHALTAAVALAALAAGCGGSAGPAPKAAQSADPAVGRFRAQALTIMTGVYDQLQPVEDAIYAVEHDSPQQSAAPLADVMTHGDAPAALRQRAAELRALAAPPATTAAARRLVDAVSSAAVALDTLGKAVATSSTARVVDALNTQQYKLTFAISAMSGEFPALFGPSPPPLPALQRTAGRPPDSRAAYIVATASVCGPARAAYDKLPDKTDAATVIAALRGETTLVVAVYRDLLKVVSPPSQAARIQSSVRAPLMQSPQLPGVEQDLLRDLPRYGEAAFGRHEAAADTALAAARRAATGLRALGSVTCADLLTDFAKQ